MQLENESPQPAADRDVCHWGILSDTISENGSFTALNR